MISVLTVFAALDSYQVAARNADKFPDPYGVSAALLRFAPLCERVPANATLAYITDLNVQDGPYGAAWMAAQYAVAPRLLVTAQNGNGPEWAVGNFSRPLDYAKAGRPLGYEVAADLGNGVVLFRRGGAR